MISTQLLRTSDANESFIGQSIKGFKIISQLGKGGCGDVFLAEQRLVKTRVAIKVLREDSTGQHQHVFRFLNEAVAVGKIKHVGIAKIFDVGFHAGRAFLIMELLEGETLTSRLRRYGKLAPGEVTEIARQLVSILEATHAEGIVHRDLKPDNVFLVPDRELDSGVRVKVLDFGIAKLGGGLTCTGEAIGTPGYMAPEQWESAATADARTDVYALGCLIFELCCGRPPFVAKSIPTLYAQQVSEVAPRARSLEPALPAAIDGLVAQMLSRAPAERPGLAEVGAVCAPLADPHAISRHETAAAFTALVEMTTVTATHHRRSRRRAWLWRSLVLASAAAGGVAMLVANRGDDRVEPRTAPTAQIEVQLGPGQVKDGMNLIPRAHYTMGDPGAPANERQRVLVSLYWLDTNEVTVREYEQCIRLGGCLDLPAVVSNPDGVVRNDLSGACNLSDRPDHPVNCVSWDQANSYCHWAGKRLPTDAEWEFAARGNDARVFPWGEELPDATRLNACGPECVEEAATRAWNEQPMLMSMTELRDAWPTTAPVGSFPSGASPFGVRDLAGNVAEWTADRPGPDSTRLVANSTGSWNGDWGRIVRGGSWMDNRERDVRATTRRAVDAQQRSAAIGFRCARDL